MRVLTVRQPWAWALVHGGKDVENRPWSTTYRGPVAVHAGKVTDAGGYLDAAMLAAGAHRHRESVVHGAVLGVVELVDAHLERDGCCAPWGQPGQHHLVVRDARALAVPVPMVGALGLRVLPADVLERVLAAA